MEDAGEEFPPCAPVRRAELLLFDHCKIQTLNPTPANPPGSKNSFGSRSCQPEIPGWDPRLYPKVVPPYTRTKNSTFVCETDGSDEGPVSELQRITSQPGIPTLPAGPIGNLKFSNCRRLLTIQYPKPSEALCFCNLALLNRMSVAQNDV